MDERTFWINVRRGLLVIIDAIGSRYDLPRSADLGLNHIGKRERRFANNGSAHGYEPPHDALARLSNSDKERNSA